jgi:hypothetical protein
MTSANPDLTVFLAPYRKPPLAATTVAVAALLDDSDAWRILAAWESIGGLWTTPEGDTPDDVVDRWLWLWSGVTLDIERLVTASMVDEALLMEKLDQLILTRIIFPDGTLAEWASRLATGQVAAALKIAKTPRKTS